MQALPGALHLHSTLQPGLESNLKDEFGVNTLKELVEKYSSAPLLPDSSYFALPEGKGKQLYAIAQKSYQENRMAGGGGGAGGGLGGGI